MATTYRAEHIGSFLRPAEVLQARVDHTHGQLSLERLREIEDKAILEALEMQRQVGVDIFSDGEFRRGWFAGAFEHSTEGTMIDPDRPADRRWLGQSREHAFETSANLSIGSVWLEPS